MAASTRTEAQQRADEIRVFRIEMDRLEREGVIRLGDDQRQAIGRRHEALLNGYAREFDIDHDVKAKQRSLGMRLVLGAVALAASAFVLFRLFT